MLMISCGSCIELYYTKHVDVWSMSNFRIFTHTIIDNHFGLEKIVEISNCGGICKTLVVPQSYYLYT